MIFNESTIRKINEWAGRNLQSKAELEAAYKAWREGIAKEDEERFAKAMKTAPRDARIVTETWEVGNFHLRKGEVFYVKDYPTCPMLTRTRGSMQGMIASSNWGDIRKHSVSAFVAER